MHSDSCQSVFKALFLLRLRILLFLLFLLPDSLILLDWSRLLFLILGISFKILFDSILSVHDVVV
jgi:hypothetical protein